MAKKRYNAAGGVVIHEGRMLLLERPARNEVRLPKGHVEAGEAVAAAALRETGEESGYDDLALVADLGSQVVEFEFEGDHVIRQEHYFLLALVSERRVGRSAQDEAQFRPLWCPLQEAAGRLTYPSEQEMARRALAAYRPAHAVRLNNRGTLLQPRKSDPVAVGDAPAGEVVGTHLDLDAVAEQDTDVVFAHLAREVSQHRVPILQLDAKHRIG